MEEKQLYGHFKRQINKISYEKSWKWLRKGNFKRETESLLTAAQNNMIRTNQMKARTDKIQQNGKCSLSGDRDPIYPTPPLGQDMTQGQFFLAEFSRFEFRVFLLLD